jgi:tRNA (guanine6-N2)-methyltransferase
MPKAKRTEDALPALYAIVLPGLEEIAAEEITRELGGEIKRTGRGIVVFRLPQIDSTLLRLRTVEDVFLLAWGTDELTYRAEDLQRIRRWTSHDADWETLLRLHHAVRPKPKGKPTVHFVAQMTGTHGYRRVDARKALLKGLEGKLPGSWRHVEEDASVDIWLTIHGATAVCGVRLSDRTMRHRTYKQEHLPASLRPTLAAAMAHLAEIKPGHVVLDPMCGAGTILAEAVTFARMHRMDNVQVFGGDIERAAVRAARDNLSRFGEILLARWDATRLPLPDASVDRIISNPPFGKQLGEPEEVAALYDWAMAEYDRVLRPGGRVVLLASDPAAIKEAARGVGYTMQRSLRVRILGQAAVISMFSRDAKSSERSAESARSAPKTPRRG